MAINITDLPVGFIHEVGQIGLWLQALGIVIVITVIFDVIAFLLNRKRLKEISIIKSDMQRIENKIDKIISRNAQNVSVRQR